MKGDNLQRKHWLGIQRNNKKSNGLRNIGFTFPQIYLKKHLSPSASGRFQFGVSMVARPAINCIVAGINFLLIQEYYIMSKFAKDVLDSSSYLFAVAKSFSDYVENSVSSRISSLGRRAETAIDTQCPDEKRSALREDMFV
jgi:hypothetical protein